MTDYTKFRPRRSSMRWLKNAPEYVVACYDNRGRTADRYTVVFGGSLWEPDYARVNAECRRDPRLLCLAMSEGPEHPQGVSIWADCLRGAHLGQKIRWLDLPEHIRDHTMRRVESTLEPSLNRILDVLNIKSADQALKKIKRFMKLADLAPALLPAAEEAVTQWGDLASECEPDPDGKTAAADYRTRADEAGRAIDEARKLLAQINNK